jgi:predicted transcriptional regulator
MTDMAVGMLDSKSKRRDKLVIMMEIIGIAKKGITRTQIMFHANLSFSQLNEYIELLLERGLLQKVSNDGRMIYKATGKGLEFVEKQQEIIGMLNEKSHNRCIKISSFSCDAMHRSKPFMY